MTTAVSRAERLSRRRHDHELRRGRLLALLSMVGLAGVQLAPIMVVSSCLHVATHRTPEAGEASDG